MSQMIWGIDIGTRNVAMFGTDGRHKQFVKLTVPKSTRAKELGLLRELVEQVFMEYGAKAIFIEEPPKVRNLRVFLGLAQTCGMLLSLYDQSYAVPVDSWKKETVGKGGVSKQTVSDWLKEAHPDYHRLCDGDQDLIDAAAICCYGQAVSNRTLDLSGRGNTEP